HTSQAQRSARSRSSGCTTVPQRYAWGQLLPGGVTVTVARSVAQSSPNSSPAAAPTMTAAAKDSAVTRRRDIGRDGGTNRAGCLGYPRLTTRVTNNGVILNRV